MRCGVWREREVVEGIGRKYFSECGDGILQTSLEPEALIIEHMKSGGFQNIEDVLMIPRSLKGPAAGLLLPGKGGGRSCEKFCHFRVVIL